ncbi:MAG TPA: hypothetical protein PLU58_00680 [Saprospiraceae bacterium]|nr:hypothetical protein [Saprospiraceae bacterium]
MTDAAYYHGFEYTSADLTKYIEAAGVFSILLRNGSVVHFFPESKEGFREWLQKHKIQNVRDY